MREGHPKGLAILFFTEMWERFSFYGMRAILVLFLTKETLGNNPGLGWSSVEATAIQSQIFRNVDLKKPILKISWVSLAY